MKQSSLIEFIYGIFLIIGGVMGFKYAGSYPSLIAGVICGMIIILCAILMNKGKKYALYIGFALTSLLTIFFGYRFSVHLGFHAIASTLFSAIVAILLLVKITKAGPIE